ncbi:dihydropteroate synthase [Natronobacillus azotifigens]|nr:dihydropteroate synthase [Natronobacillus azotifigens]
MNRIIQTKKGSIDLRQKTAVMGILNITPDSFSDGGKYNHIDQAVGKAILMESQGADIIDVGGESTRPGYTPVSEEEEIERVIPVIERINKEVSIPISIDTFKEKTAKYAVEAGADIINDVWGARREPEIATVASKYNVPIILMHNREQEKYKQFLPDVIKDLEESIRIAMNKGVPTNQIILDPGVGFAKSVEQNILVMQGLDELLQLGYPILLGTSRKSMIGKILDLPVDQRDEGTGATTCYGIMKGIDLIRVHNVELNVRMARMMDVLVGKG